MKRRLFIQSAVTFATFTALAGCTSNTDTAPGSTTESTTRKEETTTQTQTEEPTTQQKDFQTGTTKGTLSEIHTATSFDLYYAEADATAAARLADVRVPSMQPKENDPTEFNFHEAADEDERRAHQGVLRNVAYEAAQAGNERLSHPSGENLTIEHTGDTDDNGVPYVHLIFHWEEHDRETPWAEYIAGFGYGLLTNEDSVYAEEIQAAQDYARENDEGLWGHNEADEPNE